MILLVNILYTLIMNHSVITVASNECLCNVYLEKKTRDYEETGVPAYRRLSCCVNNKM